MNKTKGAAVFTAAMQDLHAGAELSNDIGSFYMHRDERCIGRRRVAIAWRAGN
jgi:hypothetical protein